MWTMRTENDDRVRRARSWLRKSKRARSDVERFLYLWISFNAAYGQTADKGRTDAENGRGPSETELQQEFLGNICEQDRSTRWLQAVVLEKECAGAIRDLVKNKFIYEPYWTCVREKRPFNEERFKEQNRGVKRSMTPGSLDPRQALPKIFDRLYTVELAQSDRSRGRYCSEWMGAKTVAGWEPYYGESCSCDAEDYEISH